MLVKVSAFTLAALPSSSPLHRAILGSQRRGGSVLSRGPAANSLLLPPMPVICGSPQVKYAEVAVKMDREAALLSSTQPRKKVAFAVK